MLLYRLAKTKYIRDLSGTGARLYGGRWNNQGVAALYTSEHRSLAVLEFLVHTSLHALPPDLSLLALQCPEINSIKMIEASELPTNWRTYPAPTSLGRLGTNWLVSQETLLLKVPSVIIPSEWNIIINPAHPKASDITVETVSSFDFDSRFLSASSS